MVCSNPCIHILTHTAVIHDVPMDPARIPRIRGLPLYRKRSIARAIPVPANHKDSLLRPPYHFTLDRVGTVGIKFGLLGLMQPLLNIKIR